MSRQRWSRMVTVHKDDCWKLKYPEQPSLNDCFCGRRPAYFSFTPDERGNVTLTLAEVEGLLRTGFYTKEEADGR